MFSKHLLDQKNKLTFGVQVGGSRVVVRVCAIEHEVVGAVTRACGFHAMH